MIKVNCEQCRVGLTRSNSDYNRSESKRFFCSASCSAIFNNKVVIKRKPTPQRFCECGKKKSSTKARLCRDCHEEAQSIIEAVKEQEPISNFFYGNDANKYGGIRWRARNKYLNSYKQHMCRNCNYKKHIHICHIKAISDFHDDAPLGVVNSLDNLIGLCPNCHWELDNGILLL